MWCLTLFKAKKSEIQRRAKRLLNAFADETRRQSLEYLMHGQRKLIRAHYEKGLLVLREDFVRLPESYGRGANLQMQIISNLLSVLKSELYRNRSGREEHLYLQNGGAEKARE